MRLTQIKDEKNMCWRRLLYPTSPLIYLAVFLVLSPPGTYAASSEWEASLRIRGEVKNDLDFDQSKQDYTLVQSRLAGKLVFNSHWQLIAEIQDARIFRETLNSTPAINSNALNQSFADDLDIHRLALKHSTEKFDITLGRQKLNLGDQRLVASLEWVNTARVHDGLRIDYKHDSLTVNAFVTELVGVDPSNFNDGADTENRYFDSQFNGLFIEQKQLGDIDVVQAWWLQRRNSSFGDDVHTLGFRAQENLVDLVLEAQASLQTGDFDGNRHDAAMAQASVTKPFAKGVLKLGFAWASGDNDSSDNRHKTFDNLYPLNHAYYGFLDLVALQNVRTIELNYQRKFWDDKLKVGAALHGFWLDDKNDFWYEAGLSPVSVSFVDANNIDRQERFLGTEFDFTLEYSPTSKIFKGFKFLAGYSHFESGDRVLNSSQNGSVSDPDFLYLQMLVKL